MVFARLICCCLFAHDHLRSCRLHVSAQEPLPVISMQQYGPRSGQHPAYVMPPNGMDMMQAGGRYGTSGEGSGFGMMPLGPMRMLSQDVMHLGMGQQLGGMMLPLASDPIHHGRQQQGAALGMMPLSSDPIHHGRQQQGAGMGMMPPLNDALHHGLQQQQQQQQQQMGLMPPPDMHRGLPQQMPMQASMQPLMQPPIQPPMPSASVAEVAYEDDLYVDEQFICPLGGKCLRTEARQTLFVLCRSKAQQVLSGTVRRGAVDTLPHPDTSCSWRPSASHSSAYRSPSITHLASSVSFAGKIMRDPVMACDGRT